jgi:hypothetical protein
MLVSLAVFQLLIPCGCLLSNGVVFWVAGRQKINQGKYIPRRVQWPRGLRRGSAAERMLGLRVRIPSGA